MNGIKTLRFNKVVYRMFGTKEKKAEQEYKYCLSMRDAKKDKKPTPLLRTFDLLVRRYLDLNFNDCVHAPNIARKKYGYFLKLDTMHAVYVVKFYSYDKTVVMHFFAEIDSPTLYVHIIINDKELVFAEEQYLVSLEVEYKEDDTTA